MIVFFRGVLSHGSLGLYWSHHIIVLYLCTMVGRWWR